MYQFLQRLVALPRYPAGNALALIGAAWSLVPLLLPREFWPQGVLTAVVAILGYLLGMVLTRMLAWLLSVTSIMKADTFSVWLGRVCSPTVTRGINIVTAPIVVALIVWARIRSNEQALLLGMDRVPLSRWVAALVLAWVLIVGFRGFVFAIAALHRRVKRGRWLVTPFVTALSVLAIIVVGVRSIDSYTQNTDRSMPDDVTAPTMWEHSGGPGSLEAWDQIGLQGKYFLSWGPTAQQIQDRLGVKAITPIRAYATIQAHGNMAATVQAALAELDRTNAWARKYLVVATATGTGWVNEWGVQAVEYLTHGNCATVSLQYSYLPSVMSVLTGSQESEDAGRELFWAVRERWEKLPPDKRPKLMVSGESLGARGGLAAFSDLQNMVDSVDGGVFAGIPAFAANYQLFERTQSTQSTTLRRENGGFLPIQVFSSYAANSGPNAPQSRLLDAVKAQPQRRDEIVAEHQLETLNFIRETAIAHARYRGEKESGYFQVAFLQHASDPVSHWRLPLLWSQPRWMENRRPDPVPPVRPPDILWQPTWLPAWTFFGVAADMPGAQIPRSGHGHSYRLDLVATWGLLLGASDTEIRDAGVAIFADAVSRGKD